MIQIYEGNGKGKTTAATGQCVRAVGSGMKVLIIRFLKGMETSEDKVLKQIGIEIINDVTLKKFTFQMSEEELLETKELHTNSFLKVLDYDVDVIFFDEIISTYNLDLIDKEKFLEFLKAKKDNVELLLTGRDAPKELIELADYVSRIEEVKHPYNKGIKARKGIEF